tara:strand:+ start:43 stop:2445 length:2403 start_codon:yes stop_codon:yes gene_type:complete
MANASVTDLKNATKPKAYRWCTGGLAWDIELTDAKVIKSLDQKKLIYKDAGGKVVTADEQTKSTKVYISAADTRFPGLLGMVADGASFKSGKLTSKKDKHFSDQVLGPAESITIFSGPNATTGGKTYTQKELAGLKSNTPKNLPKKSKILNDLLGIVYHSDKSEKQKRVKLNFAGGTGRQLDELDGHFDGLSLTQIKKVAALGGAKASGSPSDDGQEQLTRDIFNVLLCTNGYSPPRGDIGGGFYPSTTPKTTAKPYGDWTSVNARKDLQTLADFNLFCRGEKPQGQECRWLLPQWSEDRQHEFWLNSKPIKASTGSGLSSKNAKNFSDAWPGIGIIANGTEKDPVITPTKTGIKLHGTSNSATVIREWYWSFFVQFKNIKNDRNLANDTYTEFNQEGDIYGFMKFITDLITSGPRDGRTLTKQSADWNKLTVDVSARNNPTTYWEGVKAAHAWPEFGPVTEKDSWNPADIWLLKSTPVTAFNAFILAVKNAQTVVELNNALIDAHKKKIIVGISLKKPNVSVAGVGNIGYERVNLTKYSHKELPKIMFDAWTLTLPWSTTTNSFSITSNALFVRVGKKRIAKLDLGSSSSAPGNIKVQFQLIGAKAALGRVPKNAFKRLLDMHGITDTAGIAGAPISIPEWKSLEETIPFSTEGEKNGAYAGKATALSTGSAAYKKLKKLWVDKFNYIMTHGVNGDPHIFTLSSGTALTPNRLNQIIAVRNSDLWTEHSTTRKEIMIGMQIIEMAYVFTAIYEAHYKPQSNRRISKMNSFSLFMRTIYYFAKKEGDYFGSRFGPFGKLS